MNKKSISNFQDMNLDDELEILDLDEDITYDEAPVEIEGQEEIFEEEVFEEEVYEDEIYEDETQEGEVYEEEIYEEEVYEDEIYEEDDSAAAMEYDEAEEAFGRKSSPKAKKKNEKGGLFAAFLHLDTMDKILVSFGCFVLVLAILAVSVFASYKMSENQILAFSDMGNNVDKIVLIGESGLLAVTDATMANIDALNGVEEEEEEEEEDLTSTVVVKLTFTSIQKDLKIKFTNKKSGKLIAGIPFEVDVVSPSGETLSWCDDDKDGIIYYKNIDAGEYEVTLKELEGEIYERYILDTTVKTATVKKDIEYKEVDVSDEIKDESEIDASKEDTELGNTVESALTDTVAYVSPKVESAGQGYVEVSKSDIVAPTTTARVMFNHSGLVRMMMVSTEGGNPQDPTTEDPTTQDPTTQDSVTITETASVEVGKTTTLTATASGTVTWSTGNAAVATVDANGVVTGVGDGTTTITATCGTASDTCTVTVTAATPVVAISLSQTSVELEKSGTVDLVATVTGTDNTAVTWSSSDQAIATVENGKVTAVGDGTATITATSQADSTKTATCTVTVKEATVTTSITLDKTEASVEVGKDITLTATTTPTENVTVTWTSSDATVATVDGGKVTALKEGSTTITATVTNGSETKTATCTVTVTKAARSIALDSQTLEMTEGEAKTLKATVTGYTDLSAGKVTWTSSNTAVATVDENGKVTAIKAGEATITATNTENEEKVEATCKITVKAAVTLKTKAGLDVYVLSNGQYVKATSADYANANAKFYIYTDIYKYQGWQTIDGKMYYYTADYKKVTGEQVILGAKYTFDSNGVLTSSTGIMGIDVSKWNGTIDWKTVKASGVSYVIIRCGYRGSSQGALIEDPKFKTNIKGATEAGLKVGVYFFSQAIDEVEAVQEASMVLSLIKGYKISYPVFLDVEASGGRADNISKATRTAVCKAFCQTIQNSGYTAGIYANKSWLTNKIDTSQLGSYKIWLAQYATTPTYTGRYELWQYKDSGSIPGISGHVDLNLSYLGY